MQKLKKALALILTMAMLLTLLPTIVLGGDYETHWAANEIERAVEAGWFSDGNNTRPNTSITRAEFVTMVNRMKGFTGSADLSAFSDISENDWFYSAFAAAVANGYIQGSDGKLSPNANITRNEAVAIFARISGLNTSADYSSVLANVRDAASIPVWAVPYAGAAVANGLIAGSEGSFNGGNNITRAETAVLLTRLYDNVRTYGFAGTYTGSANGVVIAAAGVALSNYDINGDLTIAEAVGDGEVFLESVNVSGKLDVRGGGANSVYISGGNISEITVTKDGVRVVMSDGTTVTYMNVGGTAPAIVLGEGVTVENVTVEADSYGADITVGEGATVENVTVNAQNTNVTLDSGATAGNVTVNAQNTSVNLNEGAAVTTMSVAESAAVTTIAAASGSSIGTVTIAATGTTVSGEGTITTANVKAADVVIEQKPTNTNVDSGVTANVGNQNVEGPPPSEGGGGSGGGSSSGSGSNNTGGGIYIPPEPPPPPSSVKTATGTIKGVAVTMGSPVATTAEINGATTAGSVILTNVQANDTSNTGNYVTAFTPAEKASLKVMKYSTGESTFDDTTAYNPLNTVANGDIFVIMVTAEDESVNYYKIVVDVEPAGTDATITSFTLGGITGSTAAALGTPNTTWSTASGGAITLPSDCASDADLSVVLTDSKATVEYGYTSQESTEPSWSDTWTAQTVATGDYIGIKVTAEDGINIGIYKIAVSVSSISATVSNITVDGKVGDDISPGIDITITLGGTNYFVNPTVANDDVTTWFVNAPEGVTAKVKTAISNATTSEIEITIEGTPEETSEAVMYIVIPQAAVTNATTDIPVDSNSDALWAIDAYELEEGESYTAAVTSTGVYTLTHSNVLYQYKTVDITSTDGEIYTRVNGANSSVDTLGNLSFTYDDRDTIIVNVDEDIELKGNSLGAVTMGAAKTITMGAYTIGAIDATDFKLTLDLVGATMATSVGAISLESADLDVVLPGYGASGTTTVTYNAYTTAASDGIKIELSNDQSQTFSVTDDTATLSAYDCTVTVTIDSYTPVEIPDDTYIVSDTAVNADKNVHFDSTGGTITIGFSGTYKLTYRSADTAYNLLAALLGDGGLEAGNEFTLDSGSATISQIDTNGQTNDASITLPTANINTTKLTLKGNGTGTVTFAASDAHDDPIDISGGNVNVASSNLSGSTITVTGATAATVTAGDNNITVNMTANTDEVTVVSSGTITPTKGTIILPSAEELPDGAYTLVANVGDTFNAAANKVCVSTDLYVGISANARYVYDENINDDIITLIDELETGDSFTVDGGAVTEITIAAGNTSSDLTGYNVAVILGNASAVIFEGVIVTADAGGAEVTLETSDLAITVTDGTVVISGELTAGEEITIENSGASVSFDSLEGGNTSSKVTIAGTITAGGTNNWYYSDVVGTAADYLIGTALPGEQFTWRDDIGSGNSQGWVAADTNRP